MTYTYLTKICEIIKLGVLSDALKKKPHTP